MRLSSAIWALLLSGIAGTASASTCPASPDLANLVAHASYILTGTPQITRDQIAAGPSTYLNIPVGAPVWIKGQSANSPVVIRAYPGNAPYAPTADQIGDAAGRDSLLFLTHVDQIGSQGFYFAGHSPAALQAFSPATLSAVQEEVDRQSALLAAWHPDTNLPHYAQVQALISQLASLKKSDPKALAEQQAVFGQLESLGTAGVPAIIAQMDDHRRLAISQISLDNNFPDAFEAQRHYGPQEIVDALSALLNQMTGENFTGIMNGGSDQERAADVAGWRVYASMLDCITKTAG